MKELVTFVLARPLTALGEWITQHPLKALAAVVSVLVLGGIISTLTLLGSVLAGVGLLSRQSNLVWDVAQWLAKNRKIAYAASLAVFPFFPPLGAYLFLGLLFERNSEK